MSAKNRMIKATDEEWEAIRERAYSLNQTIAYYLLELAKKDIGDKMVRNPNSWGDARRWPHIKAGVRNER